MTVTNCQTANNALSTYLLRNSSLKSLRIDPENVEFRRRNLCRDAASCKDNAIEEHMIRRKCQ